jgi:hypothetical protein
MSEPTPHRHPLGGQFGLAKIGGWTGKWISFGQWLTGDASQWHHAYVWLDDEHQLEAMPGGARITTRWTGKDNPHSHLSLPAETNDRGRLWEIARELEGTGYSFLDYLSLALLHWKIRPAWMVERVRRSGRRICSQLVDEFMLRRGVHLFDDGRFSGDVTPGDLTWFLVTSEPAWVGQPEARPK